MERRHASRGLAPEEFGAKRLAYERNGDSFTCQRNFIQYIDTYLPIQIQLT